MKQKHIDRALMALDDLDDFARMDKGVDAVGPREALAKFIRKVANEHGLDASIMQHAELRFRKENGSKNEGS